MSWDERVTTVYPERGRLIARWGDGPWVSEFDAVDWTDSETGLVCAIRRNDILGNLLGYVGVDRGHPYYEHDPRAVEDLIVHGGPLGNLTWVGPPPHADFGERFDGLWLFGFDCAHHGDHVPGLLFALRGIGVAPRLDGFYRTIDYVRRECERLAAQLSPDDTTRQLLARIKTKGEACP